MPVDGSGDHDARVTEDFRLFTMQSGFGDADAPIVVELAQNQIYKSFREVGRVMRTVALLRFLADSGLRARVTAATNKAEAYNGFSAWTPATRA